ncbi:hypothetical protein B6K69_17905 (plasmid) [Fuscovulum blasticum]|nr:hypothetical protein B6K69_17905 [Fuscovulum blasticum]
MNAVYRLPLDETFRVDGDLLLSVSWRSDEPYAALTSADGRTTRGELSSSDTVSAPDVCVRIAVNLMRLPTKEETSFNVRYIAKPQKAEGCSGSVFG